MRILNCSIRLLVQADPGGLADNRLKGAARLDPTTRT